MKFWQKILWAAVAVIGAWCFGVLALNKGESISAVWLVVASACIYLIGYTFYGRFIAYRVFELDDRRDLLYVLADVCGRVCIHRKALKSQLL